MNNPIQDLIDQSIAALIQLQTKDGTFPSLSFSENADAKQTEVKTILTPAIILSSLHHLDHKLLSPIKTKLESYLWSQQSKLGSFNYWDKDSPQRKNQPYPDDLDDTFAAFYALHQTNSDKFTGEQIAQIVHLLTAVETEPGGPYKTWLIVGDTENIWSDIDLAVNANIAAFLTRIDALPDKLKAYLLSQIKLQTLTSPYYPNHQAILYYLSRISDPDIKLELAKLVKADPKLLSFDTPLEAALTGAVKLNLETPEFQKHTDYIIANRQSDGLWEAHPFCLDPEIEGQTHYNGSAALTSALCLELLHRSQQPTKSTKKSTPTKLQTLHRQIVSSVQADIDLLPKHLRIHSREALNQILKLDTDGFITLIPMVFYQAFTPEIQAKVNQKTIALMCVANLYGWLAYTIYDDFLDNEGDIKSLSAANFALRQLTDIYVRRLPPNPNLHSTFTRLMNTIDNANTWEVTHTRFDPVAKTFKDIPDYGDNLRLAERSVGHIMGPVTTLLLADLQPDHPDLINLESFATHYLIARQLDDEAHDWQSDLEQGHINAVAAMLLKTHQQTNPGAITLDKPTKDKLHHLFWNKQMPEISDLIHHHANQADQALQKIQSLTTTTPFLKLTNKHRKSAQGALKQRKKTLAFIEKMG